MSLSFEELVVRLFIAKARALLHDPPHKVFVLREHEGVAKDLRVRILGSAGPLSSGLDEAWSEIARRADVLASSFDRWILDLVYMGSERKYVFQYFGLLNIADPRYGASISPPDPSALDRAVNEFASELEGILRDLASLTGGLGDLERARILYSALYILLEPLWILYAGIQSPADTRVPTHSTMDHLYTAAAMVNIALQGDEPSGYLVRIDIPGAQRIVNAARKAGDFWAGSWLLSNLTWRTVKRFVREYGPDVLVSPSPRLNHYLALEIIESMREKLGERGDRIVERICNTHLEILKTLGLREIIESMDRDGKKCEALREIVRAIPLIPATAILILPSIGAASKEDARKRVMNSYVDAWREILDDVEKELGIRAGGDEIYRIALKTLKKHREAFSLPPVGARIDIVDLREVYKDLRSCLEGSQQKCEELGIDHEKNKEIEEKLKELRISPKDLAKKLVWHLALTRGLREAAAESPTPIPRAQWYIESQELETIIRDPNWRSCSLDGEEPAIVHIGKKVDERGEEHYDEEKLRAFLREIGYEDIERVLGDKDLIYRLEGTFIRPGEALGPYCLFKRLVYMAYSNKLRQILSFESTDDVALAKISYAISNTGKNKKIVGEAAKKVCEYLCGNAQKCLTDCEREFANLFLHGDPKNTKDICSIVERVAEKPAISCDEFIRISDNALKHICIASVKNGGGELGDAVKAFAKELLREYPGIEDLVERSSGEAPGLCSLYSLRSSYAIVKADADNMGEVLLGRLGPLGIDLNSYVDAILSELRGKAAVISGGKVLQNEERRKAIEDLGDAMRRFIDLVKAIEGDDRRLIISPSYSYILSASLMIASLRDVGAIIRLKGFPIYSGGDDLLALTPIESSIASAIITREAFNGEGMFHYITINNNKIPLVPAIPSGRSYSVRIASIKDVMAAEISEATEILERRAKKAVWKTIGDGRDAVSEKDTLAISDSRSHIVSLIPLSLWEIGVDGARRRRITENLMRTMTLILWAPKLGLISSGLPNDLKVDLKDLLLDENSPSMIIDMRRGVAKIIERAIRRNTRRNNPEIAENLKTLLQSLRAADIFDNNGLMLAIHMIRVIEIMRGYP